jgi:hypothetical protein
MLLRVSSKQATGRIDDIVGMGVNGSKRSSSSGFGGRDHVGLLCCCEEARAGDSSWYGAHGGVELIQFGWMVGEVNAVQLLFLPTGWNEGSKEQHPSKLGLGMSGSGRVVQGGEKVDKSKHLIARFGTGKQRGKVCD